MLGRLLSIGLVNTINDIWSEFVSNFDPIEYVNEEIRKENDYRNSFPCTFSGNISKDKFEEIVIDECERISRIINYYIEAPTVYITVISNSGLSEWVFELNFNDYGNITGRYWIWSQNDDSEIPVIVADRISEKIREILENEESDEDDEYDEEEDGGFGIEFPPKPISDEDFDELVKPAVKCVGYSELDWFSLAYEPKREDGISCIQTCLDETDEMFRVEIVIDKHDERPFHIFARDGLKEFEVLTIFYNVCLKYITQDLSEWNDETNHVKYVDDKVIYYVLHDEKRNVLGLVKIDENNTAYAWINRTWIERPNLLKIKFDVTTDYEEISEGEVYKLLQEGIL